MPEGHPHPQILGGVHKWRYPQMDGLEGKIPLKWMIWGYPHFRKPPFGPEVLDQATQLYFKYDSPRQKPLAVIEQMGGTTKTGA